MECIRGRERLTEEIVFNDRRIWVRKNSYDRTPVEVRVTCTLNIIGEYRDADIRYLIEKGDIESTTVRIIVQGKEKTRLENTGSVRGNPRNPMEFAVPVAGHLPTRKLTIALLAVTLVACGYIGILLISSFYCFALEVNFVEFAQSNPYIFIVGGAI